MFWPTDITAMEGGHVLEVAFDDGRTIRLAAERLRVESPSAEVQGHSPSQKRTVTGKERVAIVGIEPIGNYAVKPVFSDGHDSGIFSWDYLHFLGSQQDELWRNYEQRLREAGVDRDAPMRAQAHGHGHGCGH